MEEWASSGKRKKGKKGKGKKVKAAIKEICWSAAFAAHRLQMLLMDSKPSSDDNQPTSSPPPARIPLSWPPNGVLSYVWIHDLMATFNWSSRNIPPSDFPSVMPVSVFDSLVLSASKILHREPNVVRIDGCNPGSSVVVVGDVHGQLHDVLFLLQDAGFPAENRFFVFNGDYVDRGAWGLETFLLLLAWKVIMLYVGITNAAFLP